MSLDMNPQIRAQWCAALRSGEYKQGRRELRQTTADGEKFCCLGVLTDLYIKAGQPEEFEGADFCETVWDFDALLAPAVRKWAGLDASNPQLTPAQAAAELNDEGTSFAEIADLIDGGASSPSPTSPAWSTSPKPAARPQSSTRGCGTPPRKYRRWDAITGDAADMLRCGEGT